jgi:hypothetical protein
VRSRSAICAGPCYKSDENARLNDHEIDRLSETILALLVIVTFMVLSCAVVAARAFARAPDLWVVLATEAGRWEHVLGPTSSATLGALYGR